MRPVFTHLGLHVRDVDESMDFYRRFCQLDVVHERGTGPDRVIWMSEPGREQTLVFVMIGGGSPAPQPDGDYRHLGFAMPSRKRVDEVAALAEEEGCLMWPPREEPWPTGYYCGVRDPDGQIVEFSHGQPLGPGAEASA
jgi:catechol 2,3-dioxygenase-like lactoylglutathione lyase family enzyme